MVIPRQKNMPTNAALLSTLILRCNNKQGSCQRTAQEHRALQLAHIVVMLAYLARLLSWPALAHAVRLSQPVRLNKDLRNLKPQLTGFGEGRCFKRVKVADVLPRQSEGFRGTIHAN
jgi:hypothetical protein